MGALTDVETIKYRVSQRETLSRIARERKWHCLRRITAGDMAAIYDGSYAQELGWEPDADHIPINNDPASTVHPISKIEVTEITQGRVNMLMRYLKSLNQQIGIQIPQFNFAGLREPDEIQFHQLYLEQSWGEAPWGCNAMEAFDLALWDMYVCGVGFPAVTFCDGLPKVTRYDPVNVVWDETGVSTGDMQWCAIWDSQRASVWAEVFTSKAAKDAFKEALKTDRLVTLVFYYDKSGSTGTSAVFLADDDGIGEMIERTESPFYVDLDLKGQTKKRVTFLPICPLTYMRPAGYAAPMSLAENLVACAIQVMQIDSQIQRQTAVPPAKMVYWGGLHEMTQKEIQNKEEPEWWIVNSQADMESVRYIPPPPVDSMLLNLRDNLLRHMQEISDDNPFSGGTSQNPDFAREVDEMAARSGKGIAMVTRKLSMCMSQTATLYLCLAREYDDQPRVLALDDVDLTFDSIDQVRLCINPFAQPVVRENTIRYAGIQEKIAKARALVQDIQAVSPQMAMMLAPKLLEEVVNAHEHTGLAEFIKSMPGAGAAIPMQAPMPAPSA